MESTSEITSVVRAYILDRFLPGEDASTLTEDTPLVTGGILDSISTVTLVSFLEDRFEVKFQAHEMSADYLNSASIIADTIQQKRQS